MGASSQQHHHQQSIQQRLSATMGIPQQTREEILMLNLLGGNSQLPLASSAAALAVGAGAGTGATSGIGDSGATNSTTGGLRISMGEGASGPGGGGGGGGASSFPLDALSNSSHQQGADFSSKMANTRGNASHPLSDRSILSNLNSSVTPAVTNVLSARDMGTYSDQQHTANSFRE
ncbi:hypothetical protein BSLG_003031 [Batrachochytrium salamandrivorans]|nr:hypothetical protein BSLG_003031 [Batrachochytrium salamandrivorans]